MKKHLLIKSKKRILLFISVWIVCFGTVFSGYAQMKTISGTVTDAATGEEIIGVTIGVQGTSRGTVTDVNGAFTLQASADETLEISYLGYESQKIKVGNNTKLDIKLKTSVSDLEEVVVTAYGLAQKKATLTGAVSTVTNKDIVVTKNENVINSLAGKLPGVRIVQKSSMPGAYDTTVDIRGLGTPLFVVDGVPRDQAYFSRMDPEEIESVSVLKDGTAAIYGLRAANGVMLITTKSGSNQAGKVDISFTSNYTTQSFLYVPESINPIEWYELSNESAWNSMTSNYFAKTPIRYPYDTYVKPYVTGELQATDWMDLVFHDLTPQMQQNLSINGGSDKLRYFFNFSYFRQDGNLKSNDLWDERFNVRSNLDAQITQRLKARVSMGAVLGTTQNPRTDWTLYKNVWLTKEAAPVYANNNPLYYNGDPTMLQDGNNPVAQTQKELAGYNLNYRRNMNLGLTLTYDIPGIKGLQAKIMYDYGMSLPYSQSYYGQYYLYQYDSTTDTYSPILKGGNPPTATRSSDFTYDTDMQVGILYNNKFGNHNFNGTLTFEELYNKWGYGISATRDIYVNSDEIALGEDTNQKGSGGTPQERLNQAFIGQLAYDYAGKYLATIMFRYDGSSRFPKDHRWGFFPSIQAGWRISEESFIKENFDFLSNLKLRGSYGEMGDDSSANNYPSTYVAYTYSSSRGWFFNDESALSTGMSYPGIANPNLTWYKIKSYNAALEFQLWKGKLGGTFELWKRERTGLLATSSGVIPGTVGASLPQENLNADRNLGWEIAFEHRNNIGSVYYFVNPQISGTKHMVTKQLETEATNSMNYWRTKSVGRYDQIWWTRKMDGMWTSTNQIINSTIPVAQDALPGDWYGYDWNGDGVFDDNDSYPYANYGLPVFNYGINTGAGWKNFDLALNFQGAYGVYVGYSEVLTEALPFGGANGLKQFTNRWHPENVETDDWWDPNTKWIEGYYPITGRDSRRAYSNNVLNASYIRLKTLEIGYSLPRTLLSKVGIKSLRIYVSGYNLLTFTPIDNVDPERPGATGGSSTNYVDFYNYPINRTYTAGLSLKF
ncbi:MAG: TonB-dependent receptor [Dysgonamonadaceae bacterium]|jgi:TonB-linked SusC/RagA family outer membrane protein|nr:TonB-dependent receptor [Dysgonamonadaceae bacterium]